MGAFCILTVLGAMVCEPASVPLPKPRPNFEHKSTLPDRTTFGSPMEHWCFWDLATSHDCQWRI